MRNLILSTLLLAMAFQTALGEQAGDWTYTVSNNQATITGYTGAGGAVLIPSEVNGIPVVRAGNNESQEAIFGWSGNNTVTSITIPNSVTSIGKFAFYKCNALNSITIPNSVTNIGSYAFFDCTSLTSITIPNSVTSIGSYSFYNCTGLTSATILNSETIVLYNAFLYCTSLPVSDGFRYVIKGDSIYLAEYMGSGGVLSIPNTVNGLPVTEIGGLIGYPASLTITSIVIPQNIKKIGERAFSMCENLVSVQFSEGLRSIGEQAFSYT